MEKILPYLEYKSSAEEINITVNNYVGLSVSAAREMLNKQKIEYEIVGDGDVIMKQTPNAGDEITCALSKIILYTTEGDLENTIVPNLVGMKCADAIKMALNYGLNIKLAGAGATSPDANDIVIEQSLPPQMITKRGSVIVLRSIESEYQD